MNTHRRDLSADLIRSIAELQEQTVLDLVRERVAQGDDPIRIIEDCRQGMIEVGEYYAQKRYYLSGLILAGEILREVTEIIQPVTERKYVGKSVGHILLGTVETDIHDLGKELFDIFLRVHGFTVHDLGVDVPPELFVAKARELQPDVVGLSCLIVGAYGAMKETVTALRADPATRTIPIVIGGQVDGELADYVGADHWSVDVMDGVR